MTKNLYLYAPVSSEDLYQRFNNVRDVTWDGGTLSFTDEEGARHITTAPWEVVTNKS